MLFSNYLFSQVPYWFFVILQDLIEPLLEVIKVSAIQKEEKALHDRAL